MIVRADRPRRPGRDVDGIARTEADHHMKCPGCGKWFDMRDLMQVLPHVHDGDFVVGEGDVPPRRPDSDAQWRDNMQNAWAALRMIRETVETLGHPGILISEEQVLAKYGPEPIHEATAIVEALTKLLPK